MMLDEGRLRALIENRTVKVGAEAYQLRLVGLSETPNRAVMLAIAIDGTDERVQLQLSDDLRYDPIALRQRVVYLAQRIVTATRPMHLGSAYLAFFSRPVRQRRPQRELERVLMKAAGTSAATLNTLILNRRIRH
jgi:hypothetical protein